MFILQIQFPVGQGGLHLTQLRSRAQRPINIVYDCGSKNGACALREPLRLMSGLIASRYSKADRPIIDVLVLSHLHADHVNGFETLVEEMRPTIDRLIMPYYDDDQILIILAMGAYQGANYQELANLNEALSNPARWFGERGVRQIIALVPRDPKEEPPVRPIPPLSPDGPPEGFVILRGPEDEAEELSTEAYIAKEDSEAIESGEMLVKVLRSTVLRVRSHRDDRTAKVFVVIPYCKEMDSRKFPRERKQQLVDEVKAILFPYWKGTSLHFRNAQEGKNVIGQLKRAYEKYVPNAARNLNQISVLCYIGIDRDEVSESREPLKLDPSRCIADMRGDSLFVVLRLALPDILWTTSAYLPQLGQVVAWMLTGDAVLARDKDWLTVFGHRTEMPLFFQAPHHGAKANFPHRIPSRTLCMFATCNDNDPLHPHPAVKKTLEEKGIRFAKVGTECCLMSFGWL